MAKKLNNSKKLALLIFIIISCFSWIANKSGTALPTGDAGSMLISSRALYSDGQYAWPTYELQSDGSVVTSELGANTVWPPACASIIVALQKLGFSEHIAVRLFVAFFAGLTFCFVYLLGFKITENHGLSIAISVIMAFMWNSYYWIIYSFMPEGIYVSMTILSSLVAINLLNKVKKKQVKLLDFVILGIVIGLTYYIKSAAPAFILAVVLSFFIISRFQEFNITTIQTLVLLGSIGFTALPWFLRNLSIGTIGGSGIASQSPVKDSIFSLLRLFIPKHGSYFENKITIAFALLFIGVLGLIFLLTLRKSFISIFNKSKLIGVGLRAAKNPALLIPIVYCITFVVVIFFAIYVVPKASHIETRYWMEVFPFAIPVIFGFLWSQSHRLNGRVQVVAKYLMVFLAGIVFVSNVFEINRNTSKQWTILKTHDQQTQFRQTLSNKLKSQRAINYSTNYGNQLFADTGLSYWDTRDTSYNDNKLNIYLEYSIEGNKTMSLGSIMPEIPQDYQFKFQIGDYKIYIQQKPLNNTKQ